jgi:hypothetical protein
MKLTYPRPCRRGFCLLIRAAPNAAGGDKQAKQKVSTPLVAGRGVPEHQRHITVQTTGISISMLRSQLRSRSPKGSRKTAVFNPGFSGAERPKAVRVGGIAYREGYRG